NDNSISFTNQNEAKCIKLFEKEEKIEMLFINDLHPHQSLDIDIKTYVVPVKNKYNSRFRFQNCEDLDAKLLKFFNINKK
ncbi:unnamed protein product, partial [Rotaria sordida]